MAFSSAADDFFHDSLLKDSQSLVAQSTRLRLVTRSIATGMKNGSFRSLRRGQGVEFSGVRDYLQGDDVRSIDWNVTARMSKPYVKMFDEEREMVVFLIVDRSLSMETGSGKKSRLQVASEAAALLALAAEQNSSPVGSIFFDGELQFFCAPKAGKDRTMFLLKRLDSVPKKNVRGSVLANAIKGALKILKKRSLVIILSDFRSSEYEQELSRLALKHDVVTLCITDPEDSDFPDVGMLPFFDPETSERRFIPSSNSTFRKAWSNENHSRIDKFKKMCLYRGASPLILSTQDDPVFVLNRFFETRVQG